MPKLKKPSKNLPEVTMRLDYVNSLLLTYHIICAPTEMSRKYNEHLYEAFESAIPEEDKKKYLEFLRSAFCTTDMDKDKFKTYIFHPEYEDIKSYFFGKREKYDYREDITEEMMKSWLAFEKHFKPYWRISEEWLNGYFAPNKKIVEKYRRMIFDIAVKLLPGTRILMPPKIEVRVVEGIAPRWFVWLGGGVRYIIVDTYTFGNPIALLEAIIHETVAHLSVKKKIRTLQEKVLHEYVYSIEEGFAHLFTDKIIDELPLEGKNLKIWKEARERKTQYMERSGFKGTYHLYDEKWQLLKKMTFPEWYEMCLQEIKKKLTF